MSLENPDVSSLRQRMQHLPGPLLDVGLALMVAVVVMVAIRVSPQPGRPSDALASGLGLTIAALVLARRRRSSTTACRTSCSSPPCWSSERRYATAARWTWSGRSPSDCCSTSYRLRSPPRLKQTQGVIADGFPDVTVLFADIVDFTSRSERVAPEQVVEVLNDLFLAFDRLALQRRLEKIKTIGDAYMVVGGVPDPRPDHAEAVAEIALAMREEVVGAPTRVASR
jgi:hypothetical protein